MKSTTKEIIGNIIWTVILVIVMIGIRTYVVSPYMVSGRSMNDTLVDRERLLTFKMANIDRFDIVVLKAPDDPGKMYIKRVIGLPGDTIEYKDDHLILNGKVMDEPYLQSMKDKTAGNFTYDFLLEDVAGQAVVPQGTYFVMGDNRRNSLDGRAFGFVSADSIIGEADIVYWPIQQWKILPKYELNDQQTAIIKK